MGKAKKDEPNVPAKGGEEVRTVLKQAGSTKMTFADYKKACFPCLWVNTHEIDRAILSFRAQLTRWKYDSVAVWDCVNGLTTYTKDSNGQDVPHRQEMEDPSAPIQWLTQKAIEGKGDTILFVQNYHQFMQADSILIMQGIINAQTIWKNVGNCLVVVGPSSRVPIEVSKVFVLLDFDLPDEIVLNSLLDEILEGVKGKNIKFPNDEERKSVIKAATGLTESEAGNAIALSVVTQKMVDPNTVADMKRQLVKKTHGLEFSMAKDRFVDIGGLGRLKEFILATAQDPRSRGVLLAGVPGCGKSMVAKALGNEMQIPALRLDVGSLFGSLIGETEQRARDVLQVVNAMAPCILILDEVEKAMGGLASGYASDGGVGARVLGLFLEWMQDRTAPVYIVATANNALILPPEFQRAGRLDALFFVDIPTRIESAEILDKYRKKFLIPETDEVPTIEQWTGAEIESLCRVSAMSKMPLKQAHKYVIPLIRSREQEITALRTWALDKCIQASEPEDLTKSTGRKLDIDTNNSGEKGMFQ